MVDGGEGNGNGGGNEGGDGQGSGSGQGAGAGNGGGGDWRAAISDESLRSSPVLSRYSSVDDLAKGHVEARSALGRAILIPEADDDAAMTAIYDKLGRPKEATGYDPLTMEGVNLDAEFVAGAQKAAHKHGLSKKQYTGFMRDVLGGQIQLSNARKTQQQAQHGEKMAELKGQWGHSFEGRAEQAVRAALALGWSREDAEAVKNHPERLRQFAKVYEQLGEDTVNGMSRIAVTDMTGDDIAKRLAEIEKDPIYTDGNKKNDPKRKALVQEALALREAKARQEGRA